jgi:predicted CopG family antitoxin
MSDRLEDFVKQHREQFDLHEPDPSIWLKINPANAPVVRERKPMRWLRVAAAVAMIFAGSTAGIYFLTGNQSETDLYSSELFREIQETEDYYGHMVSQRYDELRPYLVSDPAAKEMLTADMEELDEVYNELKEDLKDNASNPEVIEAMILNYRVKLEILEDLLNQLKEKENQDYENNGSYSL